MQFKQLFQLSLFAASGAVGITLAKPELETRAGPIAACPSVFAIEAQGVDNNTYFIGVNSQFRGISSKPLNGRPNFEQSFPHFIKDDRLYLKIRPELYANRNKCGGSNMVSYESNADKLEGENCETSVKVKLDPNRNCSLSFQDGVNKYPYFDDYGYLYLASKPVKLNATVIPVTSFRAIVPSGGPYPVEPPLPGPSHSQCPSVFNVELKGNNSETFYMRGRDASVDNLVVTSYRKGGAEYYINGTRFTHADSRNAYLHQELDPTPGYRTYLWFLTDQEKAEQNLTQLYAPIVASVDPKKNCALTLKWNQYQTVYLEPLERRRFFQFLYIPGAEGAVGTGNVKINNLRAVKTTGPLP